MPENIFLPALLAGYRARFRGGSFRLRPGESIRAAVGLHGVPNEPGVYLISELAEGGERLAYIGRSGTLGTNGTFGGQGLKRRLCMKQGGVYREQFFREHIERHNLEGLAFEWFVTFDEESRVLPSLAEAQLLQGHYNQHGRLPGLNKAA